MKHLLFLIAFLCSTAASALTVEVNPLRLVNIKGEINGSSIKHASKIEQLADGTGQDIDIVITSGGGSVAMGSQVLSAIKIAQVRGHKVRCFVPVVAASMGFQIFIMCDERYALSNALLLWHPMKSGFNGGASKEEMLYAAKRLQAWEVPFVKLLISKLKINVKLFEYHRRNETMWMAYEFPKLSPKFLIIADDIKGAGDLFALTDADSSPF